MKHRIMRAALAAGVVWACALVGGCATESHRTLETETVASYGTIYTGPVYDLAIGKASSRLEMYLFMATCRGMLWRKRSSLNYRQPWAVFRVFR